MNIIDITAFKFVNIKIYTLAKYLNRLDHYADCREFTVAIKFAKNATTKKINPSPINSWTSLDLALIFSGVIGNASLYPVMIRTKKSKAML